MVILDFCAKTSPRITLHVPLELAKCHPKLADSPHRIAVQREGVQQPP